MRTRRTDLVHRIAYSWTGWPKSESFPPLPGDDFLAVLDAAWATDGLNRIAHRWQSDLVQFTFEAPSDISPELVAARAKGRLDHALRKTGWHHGLQRKVAVRSLGENTLDVVLRYIATHSFVLFAWYRIVFGLLVLLTAHMGWVSWCRRFFPDGKLYGKGCYYQGLLDKTFNWYYHDGAIEKRTTYNKGLKVDTSIYYIKYAKGYHPFFVTVYNKLGEVILFQEYGGDWKKRYLWTETIYDPEAHKEKIIFYFEGGQIRSIQYRLNKKDFGEYVEYDEQGKVTRQWKYDENGKVIK
jgi:hypothetical protein